ncbi:MAG TPA: cytochrome c biogenesis protein CcsA, partial [Pirellulaceae bacterium]
ISHFYIFSRLFSPAKPSGPQRELFRVITRKTYGVICFALLLSLVGTVLGGIWANDSWGRFWGWDPKENGAFMIVLWNLIILHARMGGYVKELGIHMLAVVGAIVVGFSWWYVNVMGVGLHSYGFTSGIKRNVLIFWCVELVVLGLGTVVWLRARKAAAVAENTPPGDKARKGTRAGTPVPNN